MTFLGAGIVDQDRDLGLFEDLGADRGDGVTIGQVARVGNDPLAGLLGVGQQILADLAAGHHVDVTAGIQESLRDAQPETPAAAGDHGGTTRDVKRVAAGLIHRGSPSWLRTSGL